MIFGAIGLPFDDFEKVTVNDFNLPMILRIPTTYLTFFLQMLEYLKVNWNYRRGSCIGILQYHIVGKFVGRMYSFRILLKCRF